MMSEGSPKVRKTGSPKGRVKNQEPRTRKFEEDNSAIDIPHSALKQPSTKKMEVHHHPQLEHKPKPWKEDLLEYFMIFLAVITGFFAESYREHISDSGKEHEFIVSMIEDARTDPASINRCIQSNLTRAQRLDTLSLLLSTYD